MRVARALAVVSLVLNGAGCVGRRAPLPEPQWVQNVDDEYDEGHWECPEGFHVPEVKWAGWACQPGKEEEKASLR